MNINKNQDYPQDAKNIVMSQEQIESRVFDHIDQNILREISSTVYRDVRDAGNTSRINAVIANYARQYIAEYQPALADQINIEQQRYKTIYIMDPPHRQPVRDYNFRHSVKDELRYIEDGYLGMEIVRQYINKKIAVVVSDLVKDYLLHNPEILE